MSFKVVNSSTSEYFMSKRCKWRFLLNLYPVQSSHFKTHCILQGISRVLKFKLASSASSCLWQTEHKFKWPFVACSWIIYMCVEWIQNQTWEQAASFFSDFSLLPSSALNCHATSGKRLPATRRHSQSATAANVLRLATRNQNQKKKENCKR